MGNDDSAPDEPAASRRSTPTIAEDDRSMPSDHARSVTDLIDDIERVAFRRNVTNRSSYRRYPPSTERRVS